MNNQRRPQRAFPAGGAFVLSIFRFHPDLKAEHQLQCLLPTIKAVEERSLFRAEPVVVGRSTSGDASSYSKIGSSCFRIIPFTFYAVAVLRKLRFPVL